MDEQKEVVQVQCQGVAGRRCRILTTSQFDSWEASDGTKFQETEKVLCAYHREQSSAYEEYVKYRKGLVKVENRELLAPLRKTMTQASIAAAPGIRPDEVRDWEAGRSLLNQAQRLALLALETIREKTRKR